MLSVIVPATDEPATLPRCVAAIRASLPPNAELIVETTPRGGGPAAARNAAAARARGEILVFVDSDVVIEPTALGAIASRFACDPGLTAVFGSYDDSPAAPGAVSRFRNLLHHHVHQGAAGQAETFWAGLGAVRREEFEAAGGFDAQRFPRAAIEDIELGARLRDRGGRIHLDPAIQGTHLKRWTLRSMVGTDFARRGVPWARLQLERRSAGGALNLAPRQRASALAAATAAMALATRRPAAATAATGVMVALNASLYVLLARSGGPRLATTGVGLHVLHHCTAIASVPAALASHAVATKRGRPA